MRLHLPVMSVATGGSTEMVVTERKSSHRRAAPTQHTATAM